MRTYDIVTKDRENLFSCDSGSDARKFIGDYLEAHPNETVIQIDNRKHPAPAFPYTAWCKVFNEYRGSMHTVIEQAVNYRERG